MLAVLSREVGRGGLTSARATGAVNDLGDLQVVLFPTLPLRDRAWGLRANLTTEDAIFVALAEHLGEPLAAKDRPLARAVTEHTRVKIIPLAAASTEGSTEAHGDQPAARSEERSDGEADPSAGSSGPPDHI